MRKDTWNYKPKTFKELTVGDKVYMVENGKNYPTLNTWEIVSMEDVYLQYPDRHWKKFKIRQIQGIYGMYPWMFKIYPYVESREYDLEIFGFHYESYVEIWCGHKVYSDKNVAFHSIKKHLDNRMKKNKARLKKLQKALDYEQKMMDYIHTEVSDDVLKQLDYKKK